nr:hypothetical protein [uncultured Cohaesibacter sp.]
MEHSIEGLVHRLKLSLLKIGKEASNIAVVVVADHPELVEEKPALLATRYLERLNSEAELNQLVTLFHNSNIACRVVFGFRDFIKEATEERLFPDCCIVRAVLDKTEGGGHKDGFGPARRSTGALICRLFGYQYLHADAYAAAIARHKHHQTMLLEHAGISVPRTWSYEADRGWTTGKPEPNKKVICKSTYEAWSIGVSEKTVGPFDTAMELEIDALSKQIGQPVCVQEFIDGPEIYCLVVGDMPVACLGLAEVSSSTGPKENGSYLVFDDHHRPGGLVYSAVSSDQEVQQSLQDQARKTFNLLSMSRFGRIDFRVGTNGRPYVIDIADNPGTSEASAFTFIMTNAGFCFEELPLILLAVGLGWHLSIGEGKSLE